MATLLSALKFREASRDLRSLDDANWAELLPVCDRLHLTIPIRQNCEADLPLWVRSRIDRNILDYGKRFERFKSAYLEMADAFRDAGVEHIVLKGFSQCPDFVKDPSYRPQSDLDLFCPSESIRPAYDALSRLGYETVQGREHQVTDHLPAMMRKIPWEWRGDHFDPNLPIGIELHFRLWNDATTRLRLEGIDQFWARRVMRSYPFRFPALNRIDSVGYASLHVFHHLLVGELTPYHVYELAAFLHQNAANSQLWKAWRELHPCTLRRIEAVSSALATKWFNCSLPDEVENEIRGLPIAVRRWFLQYGDSPLKSWLSPNKDSLWLHLALLESVPDKARVFCQSLFPVRVPPATAVREWSWRTYFKFFVYAWSRIAYHVRSAPRTLWNGIYWWWSSKDFR
jgi:Uncharacterised nucleotidyltransferase